MVNQRTKIDSIVGDKRKKKCEFEPLLKHRLINFYNGVAVEHRNYSSGVEYQTAPEILIK